MIEQAIYFISIVIFFMIALRILRALHIENKFEKYQIWEIKAGYFLLALIIAHNLAEIMVRFSELFAEFIL